MLGSNSGVGAGVVVCVVVMFSSVNAFYPPLHNVHDDVGRAFPCPEESDIEPCTCEYFDELILHCSGIADGAELSRVFSASFPFKDFGHFTLEHSTIGVLELGMLGTDITFEVIQFTSNNIAEVQTGTLAASYSTLLSFTMEENQNQNASYMWPLTDLDYFDFIQTFNLVGPYDVLPPLVSESLTSFSLESGLLETLSADSFTGATNLTEISLMNTTIESLPINCFYNLDQLQTVNMAGGIITTISTGTMSFSSVNLTLVDLSYNDIDSVELDAFAVPDQTVIDLTANALTMLPESVFKPLVTGLTDGYVDVTDNPLLCGCDLYWMVGIGSDIRFQGLNSACSLEGYDLQDVLDFLEYQCSRD